MVGDASIHKKFVNWQLLVSIESHSYFSSNVAVPDHPSCAVLRTQQSCVIVHRSSGTFH